VEHHPLTFSENTERKGPVLREDKKVFGEEKKKKKRFLKVTAWGGKKEEAACYRELE